MKYSLIHYNEKIINSKNRTCGTQRWWYTRVHATPSQQMRSPPTLHTAHVDSEPSETAVEELTRRPNACSISSVASRSFVASASALLVCGSVLFVAAAAAAAAVVVLARLAVEPVVRGTGDRDFRFALGFCLVDAEYASSESEESSSEEISVRRMRSAAFILKSDRAGSGVGGGGGRRTESEKFCVTNCCYAARSAVYLSRIVLKSWMI